MNSESPEQIANRIERTVERVVKDFILPDLNEKIERIVLDNLLSVVRRIDPQLIHEQIRLAVREDLMSRIKIDVKVNDE